MNDYKTIKQDSYVVLSYGILGIGRTEREALADALTAESVEGPESHDYTLYHFPCEYVDHVIAPRTQDFETDVTIEWTGKWFDPIYDDIKADLKKAFRIGDFTVGKKGIIRRRVDTQDS